MMPLWNSKANQQRQNSVPGNCLWHGFVSAFRTWLEVSWHKSTQGGGGRPQGPTCWGDRAGQPEPRHCSVWTRCPSNSKQLVRNQQWHSKAQADRLGFWVASPVGSAFRAVSIHRPWSDNSDINFIRLVKLCLLLTAPQCPGTECPPEQSPMTSPGQISKNSATV